MIALPATLLKILLSTMLLTGLAPLILYKHKRFLSPILLCSIVACFIESLAIAYFYIYSGRASWKLASISIIDVGFALEPLGMVLLNLITGLWAIYILHYINNPQKSKNESESRYIMFLGLTIFASAFIALSRNLFSMFIGYEMITFITVALAKNSPRNQPILIRALSFSSLIFLLFILAIYYIAGSNEFILGGILPGDTNQIYVELLLLAAILGIAKTSILSIYQLLASSEESANDINSIFHAIIVLNTGLYSMLKIIIYIFGIEYLASLLSWFNWPIIFSASLLIWASYKAVRSKIINHILIYSVIAGSCTVLVSAFALTEKSIMAGISHMIALSFTQITLFFAAHRFASAAKTNHIEGLKALGYRFPATSIFFVIASLSLVGVPPFAAANSRALIFGALAENHYSYIILPIIVLSIIATIYYIGRLVYFLYLGSANPEKNTKSDAVICLSTVCIVAFPIVEKFLDGILWSIL